MFCPNCSDLTIYAFSIFNLMLPSFLLSLLLLSQSQRRNAPCGKVPSVSSISCRIFPSALSCWLCSYYGNILSPLWAVAFHVLLEVVEDKFYWTKPVLAINHYVLIICPMVRKKSGTVSQISLYIYTIYLCLPSWGTIKYTHSMAMPFNLLSLWLRWLL